jgi:hypothetical protein
METDGSKYLLSLINHENIDISIDIINFIADLVD